MLLPYSLIPISYFLFILNPFFLFSSHANTDNSNITLSNADFSSISSPSPSLPCFLPCFFHFFFSFSFSFLSFLASFLPSLLISLSLAFFLPILLTSFLLSFYPSLFLSILTYFCESISTFSRFFITLSFLII